MDFTAPDELTGRLSETPVDAHTPQESLFAHASGLFDVMPEAQDTEQPPEEDCEYKGFRFRWARKRQMSPTVHEDDDAVPSPSLAFSSDFVDKQGDAASCATELNPPACTSSDNSASVTHSFLTGAKWSNIVLPWEQSWLAPIFGDQFAAPSLAMPANWDTTFTNPSQDLLPGVAPVQGAEQCVASRRLQGLAQLPLTLKKPTRQARPLMVEEVRHLHKATLDLASDLQQRVLAAHLLLMLYTRSRASDLSHVEGVLHDTNSKAETLGMPGFIQITTRYHKAARTVEKKSLLLPILASSTSAVEDEWLVTWLRLRRKTGLKVAGRFESAIQPAPNVNKPGEWLVRPLSCSEVTMVPRGLLVCYDHDLTSHSLKATCLSWAAKAELPREQRRLLGRHFSAFRDSDSVYARDLAFAPVQALQRVFTLIRDGQFELDQNRANYFKDSNPLVPGTPAPRFQPGRPAFLSKEALAEPVKTFPGEEDWVQMDSKQEQESVDADAVEEVEEVDLVSSSDSL
eukprot:s1836_g4.t1